MHIPHRFFVLCFCLLTCLVPQAYGDPVFASSKEALNTLKENVSRHTLSNGMRVLFYRRGFAPVFSSVVAVKVGGIDEVRGETGISHMFEHMAFKGTTEIGTYDYEKEKPLLARLEAIVGNRRMLSSFTPTEKEEWAQIHQELSKIWNNEQFSREYEKRGAAGLNASTDKEQTKYYVELPRPSFEFWCMMESERLLRPVMRQFYREREVVLEERRMRFVDDPMGKLYEAFMLKAFQVHPYKDPIIGYEDDLLSLTASQLEVFRKKYYVPSNIVISLVGDVDYKKDLALLEKYFGRMPVAPHAERMLPEEPKQDGERTFSIKANASPAFMVGYHKPHFPDQDDAKISMMAEVLNGSSSSPLFVDLVRRGRFAAGIQNDEVPGVASPNILLFSVSTKAPHTNKTVLAKFDETIERFKKDGTTQEQLDIAKRAIAMEYLGQMKSNMSLATTLASTELEFGQWEVLADWYLQAMQVTQKDIKEVAQRYLVKSQRTVGFLEQEGAGR